MNMKKIIELLIICLMIVCLGACGKKEENKPEEPVNDNGQDETTETVEEPTDEPELTDEQLIAKLTEELSGEWYCPNIDPEQLVFNTDGTGHYAGLDKDLGFTYSIRIDRLDTPNNGRYTDDYMTIEYDDGETEEIIFLIGDEEITGYPGKTKLLFQTAEHGGYSGVMNYFDVWVKK